MYINGAKMRGTGKGFAACYAHLNRAVEYMNGCMVRVRDVRDATEGFTCECGSKAAWFLVEQVAIETAVK